MRRYLAHRVVYRGVTHPLSLVEIDDNGRISLTPYRHETPGTIFVNGTIEITDSGRVITNPDHNAND